MNNFDDKRERNRERPENQTPTENPDRVQDPRVPGREGPVKEPPKRRDEAERERLSP